MQRRAGGWRRKGRPERNAGRRAPLLSRGVRPHRRGGHILASSCPDQSRNVGRAGTTWGEKLTGEIGQELLTVGARDALTLTAISNLLDRPWQPGHPKLAFVLGTRVFGVRRSLKRLEQRGCLEPGWSVDYDDPRYQLTELGARVAREVAIAAKLARYQGRFWNTSVLLRVLLNRRFPASLPEEPDFLLMMAAALVTEAEFEEAARIASRAADLRRDDPSVMFQAADRVRWFSVPAARDYIEHAKRLLAEQDSESELCLGRTCCAGGKGCL